MHELTEPLPFVWHLPMQLFDGHGGKNAAKICCDQLLPNLVIAHKAASTNVQIASDKEPSAAEQGAKDSIKAKIMDRNSWMGYMMDSAIESCFHTTDIQAKKISDAGTTASVLLFKEYEAPPSSCLLPTPPPSAFPLSSSMLGSPGTLRKPPDVPWKRDVGEGEETNWGDRQTDGDRLTHTHGHTHTHTHT